MTAKTKQQPAQVKQLKQQINLLTKQQKLLLSELQAEREEGLPDEETLDQNIEQVELKLQQLKKKLEKAKTHVKRRKKEITQWKANFDQLEKVDKSQELEQLQAEIAWRAKDIAAKEAEIAEFYVAKTSLTGMFENLRVKKIILEKGYHKKDLSEDPRLQGLIAETEALKTNLSKLDGK